MHKLITTTPTIHRATISIKVKIARRSTTNTLFAVLRGSWSSLKTLPLCSATRLPPKEEEARGFASPPHDGFAFIAESTPTPKGNAPAYVQVDTIGGWGSSSLGATYKRCSRKLSFRFSEFSKTPGLVACFVRC